jgi:hypothetical protein
VDAMDPYVNDLFPLLEDLLSQVLNMYVDIMYVYICISVNICKDIGICIDICIDIYNCLFLIPHV